jgi:hypothetical protein
MECRNTKTSIIQKGGAGFKAAIDLNEEECIKDNNNNNNNNNNKQKKIRKTKEQKSRTKRKRGKTN